MKVLVRHPNGDSDGQLAIHAERVLRRILDRSCVLIHIIDVKLKKETDVEGQPVYRCTLTVKLFSDNFVKAEASDGEEILAVYRAADKVKFLVRQQSNSAEKVNAT